MKQQATSKDPEDRFGMPESAFRAARESPGLDNPTIRSGMYVPTRREVAGQAAEWLYPVLIDWRWESPSELIPSRAQIAEVRAVILARPMPLTRQWRSSSPSAMSTLPAEAKARSGELPTLAHAAAHQISANKTLSKSF